ncbi:MAG: hypothetical protein CFE21_14445 [Bacteroidetes bacterium B1(2017)]|nr:MAG: hypothetical protein CFE21_14445 [Bacteroidetes bacterium B1(2017)]
MRFYKLNFGLFLLLFSFTSWAQLPKLTFNSNQSLSYSQLLQAYQRIDSLSEFMKLTTIGYSDAGTPLNLLIVNKSKNFSPSVQTENRNAIWLLMNGIHPGESEGIDASVFYLEALAKNPKLIPDSITILVIPCYNIDGMRNRKKYTRANQNGPEEKGFRASACNYDLNRDFLKADSKNTFAFYNIFSQWKPDVFLDTHTSNGADYQYTMTLISTQKDKLGGPIADLQHGIMTPWLYANMKKKGYEMSPYVNVFGQSPDQDGFEVFIESPKFSTGYTSLFGTLGFVAETHMLKPYPNRVKATYALLESFQVYISHNKGLLVRTKTLQEQWMQAQTVYPSNYKVSRESHKDLDFKGFELEKKPSTLGGYERNFYNTKKPFQKTIPYYDSCVATVQLKIPSYFILPQSWAKAAERLKANGINYISLANDTLIRVNANYIKQIKHSNNPYEGHFVHSGMACETRRMEIQFYAGDLLIPTHQKGIRYLMEVLSPQTADGFMAWNFFDPILNEKEGFSDYAFEEDAKYFLETDTVLAQKFEDWKTQNPEKLMSKYEVLGFIYKNSPYYEKEHLRFPVYTLD